jgi:hypothetical protein
MSEQTEHCEWCGWEGLTTEVNAHGGYCPSCGRQEDLDIVEPAPVPVPEEPPYYTDNTALSILAKATEQDTPALRDWMHNGEYEGGRDAVMDESTGQTNAEWVDTMPLDELIGYISDHIGGYSTAHCTELVQAIERSQKRSQS